MMLFLIISMNSCICYHIKTYRAAKEISRDFERKYTGLDTLIRLDGYYYYQDSSRGVQPIFFKK